MNGPYARLRAIIAEAEVVAWDGQPRAITAGEFLVHRLRAAGGDKALRFEATASEVTGLRSGAKRALGDGERVSVYRLDPRGPGGAGRKTTWEAVLIRPGKVAA